MKKLFVTQRARFDPGYETFSSEGLDDAHQTAIQVVLRGFERRNGIILSSDVWWAEKTAEVIRERVDVPTILSHPRVTVAGLCPQSVEYLWDFTRTLLEVCDVEHTQSDVLIVTHKPLVQAVAGYEPSRSGVYPVAEAWRNPGFDPEQPLQFERPQA